MATFHAVATLRNLRLLTQSSQCLLPIAGFGSDQISQMFQIVTRRCNY